MQAKIPTQAGFPEYLERFNSHQRWQHFLLFISMALLFITGFPIKWSGQGWAQVIIDFFGGFENLFRAHLINGVLMVVAILYHLIWLVINFSLNGPKWSMVPNLEDAKNVYYHALYLLRLRKEPPPYDRYTYLEKFEYLAGGYGAILMGLTGFFLWFPDVAALLMPRWVLHLLRIAHSNEAIVASMAVIIGHFFWVHFHPDVFPTSKVWYNGKISRHHQMEEHILEYQRLAEQYGAEPAAPAEHHASRFSNSRLFIGIEFIIYTAVCLWLYAKLIPMLIS